MDNYGNAVAQEFNQLPPTMPREYQDSFRAMLIRRVESTYTYMLQLNSSVSLTRQRREAMAARIEKAAKLNERYVEILPLSIDAAGTLIRNFRTLLPAGEGFTHKGKAAEVFYNAVGKRCPRISQRLCHRSSRNARHRRAIQRHVPSQGDQRDSASPQERRRQELDDGYAAPAACKLGSCDESGGQRHELYDGPSGNGLDDVSHSIRSQKFRLPSAPGRSSLQILELLLSKLKTAVLTNDVAMGRTLTVAVVLLMKYYHYCELRDAGKPFEAGAVFWATQANLVSQTFIELFDAFPEGVFKLYCYYGNSKYDHPAMAAATITRQQLGELCVDWSKKKDDPKVRLRPNKIPSPEGTLSRRHSTVPTGRHQPNPADNG